jgi:hypothetical protein
MQTKFISSTILTLLAVTPLISAQTPKSGTTTANAPKSGSPTAAPEIKTVGTEFRIPTTGFTKDNGAKVQTSLLAMTEDVFVCPTCNKQGDHAANCGECKVELKTTKMPVFTTAVVADTGMITVTTHPDRSLSLNRLDEVLQKNAVKVDDAKFALTGPSTLIVKGVDQAKVAEFEKLLMDSKMFQAVHATLDPKTGELWINVVAKENAPTRATLAELFEKSSLRPQLTNVVLETKPTEAS